MAEHYDLGKEGEDMACEYLISLGYTILARNWRAYKNEIDIIALKNNCLIFIEVKTRTTDLWGNPEDFISEAQQQRIIEAAEIYIEDIKEEYDCRFDVIAIIKNKKQTQLEHFEDAF